MIKFSAAALATLALPGIAMAQAAAPPPPCQSEEYRAFDFWIGEWDVYSLDGNLAGTNSIQVQESGCMLLEKWTSAQGSTGQSYNFYDPGMKQYRQVWVSGGAVIDYAGGLNNAGEMVLEGTINYHSGQTAPFKGTWTLQEDGSVRQHFQQYDGANEVWNDWFTGIYKRRDE